MALTQMVGRDNSFEMRFILSVLRVDAAASKAGLHEFFGDRELRWDVVFRLASWHGVTALLARGLQAADAMVLLPADVRLVLEQRARECSFRAMAQVAAMSEIQLALEEGSVAAIAWKGPALASDLYGSYSLRASSDLDFLVQATQMADAIDCLTARGFVITTEWAKPAATERAKRMNCELQMVRMRDRMPIELHNEVMPELFGKGMSIERCIERARWLQLDGRNRVRVLALEDLLVSLCAHGSKHGWERLKWICDIAAFMTRYRSEVQWSDLLPVAQEVSSLEAVLGGIRLADTLLGALPSEELRQCMSEKSAVRRYVAAAVTRIESGSMETRSVRLALRDALDTAGTRPARARYLLRRSLSIGAVDLESFTLPASLTALYYPLRVARVMTKTLRGCLSRRSQTASAGRL